MLQRLGIGMRQCPPTCSWRTLVYMPPTPGQLVVRQGGSCRQLPNRSKGQTQRRPGPTSQVGVFSKPPGAGLQGPMSKHYRAAAAARLQCCGAIETALLPVCHHHRL